MTFCSTFSPSRTEVTMRTYSWTVPLDERTLTDRMNIASYDGALSYIVNT